MHDIRRTTLALAAGLMIPFGALGAQAEDKNALIQDALSAAPAELAGDAKIMDWQGNVLREGANGYTCMPTPPGISGTAPMCLDDVWLHWAHAWQSKTTPELHGTGVAYMLAGDQGASNTDPYATEDTGDNDWVVAGPHLMIVVPDPTMLDGVTTDYTKGVPWVMWKGTPYAHIMVPVGEQASGHH